MENKNIQILVLDNYDSFVYNLVHYVKELGYKNVDVYRNDKITLEEVGKYDKIILSPGPGIPDEAGILKALIKQYGPIKPLLGVCLGHQAISEVYGAFLENRKNVLHGVATKMIVTQPEGLYEGLPQEFEVGRYHSWQVDPLKLGDQLEVTAIDEAGDIMSIRHKVYPVTGVQYHPESILTEYGKDIMKNWLKG